MLKLSKKTVGIYRARNSEQMDWRSRAEIIHDVFRNRRVG